MCLTSRIFLACMVMHPFRKKTGNKGHKWQFCWNQQDPFLIIAWLYLFSSNGVGCPHPSTSQSAAPSMHHTNKALKSHPSPTYSSPLPIPQHHCCPHPRTSISCSYDWNEAEHSRGANGRENVKLNLRGAASCTFWVFKSWDNMDGSHGEIRKRKQGVWNDFV